jgi:hypothetical protein
MVVLEAKPNIKTLAGMKILAIRPISNLISGGTSLPTAAARAYRGAMWYIWYRQ